MKIYHLFVMACFFLSQLCWPTAVQARNNNQANASPLSLSTGATVTIENGQGNQGDSVVVALTTDLPAGTLLGAVTVEVHYDPAVADATVCTPDPNSHFDTRICNKDYDNDGVNPDIVRLSLLSTAGVSGHQVLANLTFKLTGANGATSPVGVVSITFTDINGVPIPVTPQNGILTINTNNAVMTSGSGQGNQGDSVMVALTTDLPAGTLLGAVTVEVHYDPAIADATLCTPDPDSHFDTRICNKDYDNDGVNPVIVRLSLLSTAGVSGHQVLANLTFHLTGANGATSPLGVVSITYTDINGVPIPVTPQNGQLRILNGFRIYLPGVLKN